MDGNFLQHITKYIGQTVTVFTTSGGASGCGFTGVLLFVNPSFLRLMVEQGTQPSNPLSREICDMNLSVQEQNRHNYHFHSVGSVCDIPINKIASFCHNAV